MKIRKPLLPAQIKVGNLYGSRKDASRRRVLSIDDTIRGKVVTYESPDVVVAKRRFWKEELVKKTKDENGEETERRFKVDRNKVRDLSSVAPGADKPRMSLSDFAQWAGEDLGKFENW